MTASPNRIMQLIAVYWPGVVLLCLFASTTQEVTRHFVGSLGLAEYLGLWFLALLPSPVLAFVAERMGKGARTS